MADGDQSLETLGGRLRWGRKQRGVTQPQLGEVVGAESQQIWKYEKDKRVPGPQRLLQMARFLRLNIWWLVFREGSPDADETAPELPAAVVDFLASDLAEGLSEWTRGALREIPWAGTAPDVGDVARVAAGLQRVVSHPDT